MVIDKGIRQFIVEKTESKKIDIVKTIYDNDTLQKSHVSEGVDGEHCRIDMITNGVIFFLFFTTQNGISLDLPNEKILSAV